MKCLLVLLWVGCDAGVLGPEPVAPPGPQPAPAQLPFVTANGHTYAIVQVRSIIPEVCSNMGGTNWVFTVDGMPSTYRLHGGGHGIFGRDTPLPLFGGERFDDVSPREPYYVADVSTSERDRLKGYFPCSRPDEYDGTVIAVSPARDLADARAQLAAAPREGLPHAVRIDTFGR